MNNRFLRSPEATVDLNVSLDKFFQFPKIHVDFFRVDGHRLKKKNKLLFLCENFGTGLVAEPVTTKLPMAVCGPPLAALKDYILQCHVDPLEPQFGVYTSIRISFIKVH